MVKMYWNYATIIKWLGRYVYYSIALNPFDFKPSPLLPTFLGVCSSIAYTDRWPKWKDCELEGGFLKDDVHIYSTDLINTLPILISALPL